MICRRRSPGNRDRHGIRGNGMSIHSYTDGMHHLVHTLDSLTAYSRGLGHDRMCSDTSTRDPQHRMFGSDSWTSCRPCQCVIGQLASLLISSYWRSGRVQHTFVYVCRASGHARLYIYNSSFCHLFQFPHVTALQLNLVILALEGEVRLSVYGHMVCLHHQTLL
jgi:hypothetical protein